MSIATTDYYDTEKYEVKSFVTATHTEALSLFRGLAAELGGLIGGKSDLMNKKVNDVMNKLIEKLRAQLGVKERIVGARFEFTEFGRSEGNTFLSGIATGTVIAEKPVSGGSRRLRRKSMTRKHKR
jgi:uncharacterized protein YbjQ (UPF0145 family)